MGVVRQLKEDCIMAEPKLQAIFQIVEALRSLNLADVQQQSNHAIPLSFLN